MYKLIWQRTMASQMTPSSYRTKQVEICSKSKKRNKYVFSGTVEKLEFPGFLVVYGRKADDSDDSFLDKFAKGTSVFMMGARANQVFTVPKPHMNEAALVKKLSPDGIGVGRP